MVLHAHGALHGPLRQARLQEQRRQRPRARRGRQEDVQAPEELPRPERRHGPPRRGRAAGVPHQLARGPRRVAALLRRGRVLRRARGAHPVVQCLPLLHAERAALGAGHGAHVRPLRGGGHLVHQRRGRVDQGLPQRPHHDRPPRDGRLPPLQRAAAPAALPRGAHQLVRAAEPREAQGRRRRRGGEAGAERAVHGAARHDRSHGPLHALLRGVPLPAPPRALRARRG
mmetsp:Transcript_20625/g.70138  ORF Transcript_20625/g.70138 Transcript_20625/m.70138 type:complete len:228 (-) Transcript_20625:1074-1757(-)